MYIVVYRLTNLLNNSQYNSTTMHMCRQLLGMVTDLERMSIDQVAERCNVSKSTLSKFVKILGFENYKDFRENAAREKEDSSYTGNAGLEMEKYIEKYRMDNFLKLLSRDVEQFMSGIDMQQVRRLVKALYEAPRVAAFGMVYSETVAMDFVFQMAELRKTVETRIHDLHQEEYFQMADEDTLIVIFSNTGQYIYQDGMKTTNRSRSFVRKTRAKKALITSNKEALREPYIDYPVLFSFTSVVQNQVFMERLMINVIVDEYKSYKRRVER
ncbi:MAG: MurR/RpiR family transcriptional regulator [Lachnospiraceae bacterium]|jgi:DNA-binding MurR/RpiR family transcriptional regulator|nr:MurR/RpiR family transcriptional regulator [Lachnospiraceae bacterium]